MATNGSNASMSRLATTTTNMVEATNPSLGSGDPQTPRIMTSSPGINYNNMAAMSGQLPAVSRAATLSALGSSIGSSGGGMSDSGFAASTSSGFGPGSSTTGSTTGVAPNKPDLSHLTPEERAIIENVIHRQQNEESMEYQFLR